jgi:hypothetical protein
LTGVGKKVTFYINSSKNEKVALYMEVNNYDTAKVFSDWADLSVNGTGYSSSAAMPVGNSWTPSNKQVFIAYIDLKEGNNDIVFTVNTAELAYNIYGIKLAAESAILTWGSKDIVAGDEENNNESKTEIFYAVTSDGKQATGVTISGGLAIDTRNNDGQNSDRTNAAGHGCIKGFNNVGGALTFNINSSAEKKVDLYGEFSFTNTVQLLSEWITLTVVNSNGTKTYDLGDAATLQGINYTPSDAFIFLSEIDLTEGDNQIIITSSSDSNGLNVWGIKLASKSAAVTISTTEE